MAIKLHKEPSEPTLDIAMPPVKPCKSEMYLSVRLEPETNSELAAMNALTQIMKWYEEQNSYISQTERDKTLKRISNWFSQKYS